MITLPLAMNSPKNYRWTRFQVAFFILSLCHWGCTTRLKPLERVVEVPQTKRVVISLEGIDPLDYDRKDIVFEVSECIEPTLGSFNKEDKTLSVVHSNLSSTMVCSLSVKKLDPDTTMKFMTEDKPKIMYQTHQVIITQDMNGKLQAVALLQKLYY